MRWILLLAAVLAGTLAWLFLQEAPRGAAPSAELESSTAVRGATPASSSVALADVGARTEGLDAERVEASAPEPDARATIEFPPMRARVTLVVTAGGEPLVGATVELDERVDPVFHPDPADATGAAAGAANPSGVQDPANPADPARTNARGEASFFVRSMRTVFAVIRFEERGWSVTTTFTSPLDGRTRRIPVELLPASVDEESALRVVSEPGFAPIPGAAISAFTSEGLLLEIATDEKGCARVPRLPRGTFTFQAEGHATKTLETMTAQPDGSFEIVLRRHARIHGIVQRLDESVAGGADDDSGRPSTVVLANPMRWDDPLRTKLIQVKGTAEIDPEGRWSIDGIEIPPDFDVVEGLSVTANIGGFRHALTTTLTLSPGDDKQVLDPWIGAPAWTLRFVNPQGEPLSGAQWLYLTPPGFASSDWRTAAVMAPLEGDGSATLPAFPVGTWEYRLSGALASQDSFVFGEVEHRREERTTVEIDAVESIAGRVETKHAWKFRGPHLELTAHKGSRFFEVKVQANGTFRIDLVPGGGEIDLVVRESAHHGPDFTGERALVPTERVEVARTTVMAGDQDVVLQLPD